LSDYYLINLSEYYLINLSDYYLINLNSMCGVMVSMKLVFVASPLSI
jgi:hypothetical protein